MQIIRLKEAPLHRLETLVEDGEDLTADLVRSLFKRQVNQGLASVQTSLSQMWTALPGPMRDPAPTSLSSPTVQAHAPTSNGPISASTVLAILKRFEVQTQYDPILQRVSTLTKVLIKELEMVLSTVPMTTQEGETSHV